MKSLNLKFKLAVFATMFCFYSVKAQKPLSQAAIKDFAHCLSIHYNYGSDYTKAFITFILQKEGVYGYEKVVTVVENVGRNTKYREMVFKGIFETYYRRESIFANIYGLGLTSAHSSEITTYIINKYGKPEVEEYKPAKIVWKPKSKIFFEGTKTFYDSLKTYKYIVTIKERTIKLELFPGENNTQYEDSTRRITTYNLFINGDKIVGYTNSKTNFKYENGTLYELNDDNVWIAFTVCKP